MAAALRMRIGDTPRFSQDGAESWHAYLATVRSLFAGGGVPDDQRVVYLASGLRGKALDTLLVCYGVDGIPPNPRWDDVIATLKAMFTILEAAAVRTARFAMIEAAHFPNAGAAYAAFVAAVAVNPVGLDDNGKQALLLSFVASKPLVHAQVLAALERPNVHFVDVLQILTAPLTQALWGVTLAAPAHQVAAVAVAPDNSVLLSRIAALEQVSRRRWGRDKGRREAGKAGAGVDASALQHDRADRGFWSDRCFKCGRVGHLSIKCSSFCAAVSVSVGMGVSAVGVGEEFMLVHGQVEGRAARILLDSGSRVDVVSRAFVVREKLVTVRAPKTALTFANGDMAMSAEAVSAGMQLGDLCDMASLRVCPLGLGVDVILGQPWLSRANPSINWSTGRVVVGAAVILQGCGAADTDALSQSPPVQICMLSARAMRRERNKAAYVEQEFALWVAPMHSESSSAAATAEAVPLDPRVMSLLDEFADVFPDELPAEVPPTRGAAHKILLEPGAEIPRSRPYRLSAAENDEVTRQVQLLLAQHRIRPCESPFGAPVLLVKKKDGTWRMCVDYRLLNRITIKDRFPLPLIEDLLDRMLGSVVFSKIDLRSGFHQVAMDEESVARTAFITSEGAFEWRVMPMGLSNAPAAFQRTMQAVVGKQLHASVEIYIDDNVVHTQTESAHLMELRKLFTSFRQAKLYARRDKCVFFVRQVVFCGHVVGHNTLAMEHSKVEAIRSWLPPTTIGELRMFIGFINYYRRFLRHIGEVASPLTAMLGSNASSAVVQFNTQQSRAFEQLKIMVTEQPVLCLFDPSKPVAVFADSSALQAGSFWAQDHGKGFQPGSFESHKLSPAECNYSVRDKELLSVVQACRRWRHYLYGQSLCIRTTNLSSCCWRAKSA